MSATWKSQWEVHVRARAINSLWTLVDDMERRGK